MKKMMTERMGDLAMFWNMNAFVVWWKLRKALNGDLKALQSMNIHLTTMEVQTKAIKMGLVDTKAGLYIARYALILEKSKYARGEFWSWFGKEIK